MPLACFVPSTFPGRMSGRITHLLSLHRGAPLSTSQHKNTNTPFSWKTNIKAKCSISLSQKKKPVSASKITQSVNSTVNTPGSATPPRSATARVAQMEVAPLQALPVTHSCIEHPFSRTLRLWFPSVASELPGTGTALRTAFRSSLTLSTALPGHCAPSNITFTCSIKRSVGGRCRNWGHVLRVCAETPSPIFPSSADTSVYLQLAVSIIPKYLSPEWLN